LSTYKNSAAAKDWVIGINRDKIYLGFGRGGAVTQFVMKTVGSRNDTQPARVCSGIVVGDEALNTDAAAAVGTSAGVLGGCWKESMRRARIVRDLIDVPPSTLRAPITIDLPWAESVPAVERHDKVALTTPDLTWGISHTSVTRA
jgi:hypothetical protein